MRRLPALITLFSLTALPLAAQDPSSPDGYTINYTQVSIIEYLKFASKVCNVNFLFNEEDLPFTVTVVSDAPATSENVMATLLQILRIHGLSLLEQGNNLVIHKSPDVKQIPTLITDSSAPTQAGIVTRIFRLRNTRADSIAAIIRPMISTAAIIETLPETRQLVLTDIRLNVDKVAQLIENVDAPQTPFSIASYIATQNAPEYLIGIASQIMGPIAEGNPFLMVPQELANTVYIVSTPELTQKAIEVLTNLDTPPKRSAVAERRLQNENIFIYKLRHRNGEEVIKGLENIADSLESTGAADPDLLETIDSVRWIKETNSLMVVGGPTSLEKVKEFLTVLDAPTPQEGISFFVYKPQNKSAREVERSLKEITDNLAKTQGSEEPLLNTLRSAELNPSTNSLLFSGDPSTFPQVQDLLNTADAVPKGGKSSGFLLYPIVKAPKEQIIESLKNFSDGLVNSPNESDLRAAIGTMKYIPESNSLMFTGPNEVLGRLQTLLGTFDTDIPLSNQFYIYKPQGVPGDVLAQSIRETAQNLKSSGLADPAFMRTVESMKWVKSTNSLLFTGDSNSLQRLEQVISSLDSSTAASEKNFILFQPVQVSMEAVQVYLKQLGDNLNRRQDGDLVDAIRSGKWMDSSGSFMFHGTQASLDRLLELLNNFDRSSSGSSTYSVYQLQYASGSYVEEQLDEVVASMKKSGLRNTPVIQVIDEMRWVKDTNTLVLTGDPKAIAEAKELIANFDRPNSSAKMRSNFFLYKPQHLTAPELQKSIREIAASMRKAELADPSLLSTLDSVKIAESTGSLIFAGPPDAIAKVQEILQTADSPAQRVGIQTIGQTTFLIYKLQHATGPHITASLKGVATDLKKSGSGDKEFVGALQTMKYIPETNSLMFTGPQDALVKVQALVEKFDVQSLGPKQVDALSLATEFFVYKPVSVAPLDLEKMMQDFADQLKASGLSDPSLYRTIESMRIVDKTQTIVFSGDAVSLGKVKALLSQFDIASNLPEGSSPPSIQAIDNTSFLVYKLQFHRGDELQSALRQVAHDLQASNVQVNQNLLNSINTLQWIQVTNSLLCTGDQETLTRLRELIKNLDIPLKQVFIEVLMIQTNLTNSLAFGLDWVGDGQYRNKLAFGTNNSIPTGSPSSGSNNASADSFTKNINDLASGSNITPSLIPLGGNFDFGIIGQVVKHNGTTFFNFGSLLQALTLEEETTILMTPKIIAQDGKQASVFVGQNIPFIGSFVQNTQVNTMNTANIEYRNIGITLTITPVLGNSDVVTLDISLNQSTLVGSNTGTTVSFTANQSTATALSTSQITLDTTVHVPDNNFLVLSGFVNNSMDKNKSGVPCLGSLPLLGAAFSQNNTLDEDNTIVIFMRPHIINSLDDIQRITKEQEEFFRDQMSTPFLQHNYDESLETIKTIDDE